MLAFDCWPSLPPGTGACVPGFPTCCAGVAVMRATGVAPAGPAAFASGAAKPAAGFAMAAGPLPAEAAAAGAGFCTAAPFSATGAVVVAADPVAVAWLAVAAAAVGGAGAAGATSGSFVGFAALNAAAVSLPTACPGGLVVFPGSARGWVLLPVLLPEAVGINPACGTHLLD